MAQMQALLKIKADVEGEGKVNALGRAIGGLSGTAGKVSGGLKGLAGAAGGLSNMLGALVPLATGAGLVAMAKGAIDAADNMNDLSQKTGVSVESLSKFQQAANASGTSIEGVGAAMIKLNKGLGAGTGPATEALKSLGISATDASGKLKSTDTVMLEVADKFAKMPDGANKTALAMQLFGKAGADMIPLLNGGSKAITDLSATMTTGFAQAADSLNDKLAALQGKLLELGVNIGTALMPALNVIADLVLNAANAFAAMPGPIQAIIGGTVALAAAFVLLAPAISAVISIAGVLAGLKIGATIAGWAALAGPAITAISAAFTGLLTFLTGTLLPGLVAFFSGPVGWTVLAVAAVVAMVVLFREPIMQFFAWLGGAISKAFSGLMGLLQPIFVQPFIDLWNNVLRGPVTAMIAWLQSTWASIATFFNERVVAPIKKYWSDMVEYLLQAGKVIGQKIGEAWNNIATFFNERVVAPIKKYWSDMVEYLLQAGKVIGQKIGEAWNNIATFFNERVVRPIIVAWDNLKTTLSNAASTISTNVSKAWNGIANFFTTYVTTPITKAWTTVTEFFPKAINTAKTAIVSVFTSIGTTIKSILNGIVGGIINTVNKVINEINFLIGRANGISAKVKGPQIPILPKLSIPEFAKGGVVTGPTLAMVGEGGESEYIVPESKAAAFAANYLNGARGAAAIPAFANGGYVGANRGGSGNAQINITTGPVTQIDNQRYATIEDLQSVARQTATQIYATLRTPAGRRAIGVA